MNYIGSKKKLKDFIVNTVKNEVGEDLSDKVFCDLFAGTGIVGRTFNQLCKKIISNDLEYYSFVTNNGYLKYKSCDNTDIFQELNQLPLEKGTIFEKYYKEGRLYFTEENSLKIDTIRKGIEKYKYDEKLYYYLLMCLIEEADAVANVASVYGAYLKKFKKSSQKPLVLSPIESDGKEINEVYNESANDLIKKISGDILYLDPPYNGREYGANYHMLNTIAKFDDFEPKGKTGLREYKKSNYCKKGMVKEAIEEIIKEANFKYIFMSYNNEGLLSLEDIKEIFSKFGLYKVTSKVYTKFSSHSGEESKHTTEYIHILTKNEL